MNNFAKHLVLALTLTATMSACSASDNAAVKNKATTGTADPKPGKNARPDDYWKKKLDADTYAVTRCSATEPAFRNKYWNNHASGEYKCSNCGELLFTSKEKFDSGTGWPSFTDAQKDSVASKEDNTLGMTRTEVVCKHCGAHLGHLFDDGPAPGGKRYCINSASLDFKKQ